jgi:preprotein translocase subunit SecG
MATLLMVILLILAVLLIGVVLLQPSKGDMVGSAFGGIGGQMSSMMGARGSLEFFHKATITIASLVVVLSILVNLMGNTKTIAPENQKAATEQVNYDPSQDAPVEVPAPAGN